MPETHGKLDELPGFKHFIDVLKSHGLGADLHPPVEVAPRAGELVAGDPFDPVLAKLYELCSGGEVGDLQLFGLTWPEGGLGNFNVSAREREEPRIQKLFRFAKVFLLPYYLATVPSLADENGIQPVVFLNADEQQTIEPIASDVDRALGLYGSYLDRHMRNTGSLYGEESSPRSITEVLEWVDNNLEEFSRRAAEGKLLRYAPSFPLDFVDDIVKDQKLVRMLAEGRFDELARVERDGREWVEKVLARARALGTTDT